MATPQSFQATIEREGQFTFVPIPFSPRDAWGPLPRYRVTGTIDGVPVRGTLGALGSDYFLRLSKAWLKDAHLDAGATVQVELAVEATN